MDGQDEVLQERYSHTEHNKLRQIDEKIERK